MRILWLILLTGCNVAATQDVSPFNVSQEPQGPVETYLFCHNTTEETPRSVPLSYRQIGEKITPVANSNVYYVPDGADREFATQGCQRSSFKVIPAEHEWKEGLIEGASISLKYTPPVYGYVEALKTFEQGLVNYSPNQETHLKCHAIIEIMSSIPIVITPGKTEELITPYKQKDGKTFVMTSPPQIVSETEGRECEKRKIEYQFEKRSSDSDVVKHFQTIDAAIP